MKNLVYSTVDTMSLPVGAGVSSGDPVAVGVLAGVALTDSGDGGNASDHATVLLPPAPSVQVDVVASGDVSVGDQLWIDDAGAVSNAVDGVAFGVALDTVADTETTAIAVRLANGPTVETV